MPTISYDAAEIAMAAHLAAQTAYGSAGAAPTSAQLRAVEEIRPLASALAKHKAGIENSVTADATRTANTVFAGPTSGSAAAATFRTLVTADLPTVPYTKGGTGLTALGTALQVLRTNAGATAIEWGTVSGGGSIDGSGTADYLARWTDSDTLAAAALRDDGTRAAIGQAPASDASLTVKAQAGDSYNVVFEGTGGVIVPTVVFRHAGETGVRISAQDSTGFQFANVGEGTTLYVKPGYPESYLQTHPSSAGRFNFQTHDGSAYVSALAITDGKVQIDDGGTLVDISIAAGVEADVGFRALQVPV